jgi:hypothetical protein
VQSTKKKQNANQELPPKRQTHVLADDLCKRARGCCDQTTYFKFPACEATLFLNDKAINANVTKAMTTAYHSISLQEYLQDKWEWTNQQKEGIWWKIHQRSMSKINSSNLVRIQNFNFNYLPTNKRQKMYYNENHICVNPANNTKKQRITL